MGESSLYAVQGPAVTWTSLVVTARTVILLRPQMAKPFILLSELHGHKKSYYNVAIHVTMFLGEESAAQAKMRIRACLADMLQ